MKVITRMGIPLQFVTWVHALYRNSRMRVFLNSFASGPILIKSGVRQGDLLSCPFFVIAIEGLACSLQRNDSIKGLQVGHETVKTTLYADDTTVFLRNQAEARVAERWLQIYCKVSGAKVNWGKSYLLLIGDPGISLPSVRIVFLEQPYKYLGIPVGVDPTNHLQDFWDEMVEKFRKTVSSWRKYHHSLKGRCLVANSLLMSIPRYAVRFLDLPPGVKGELDREYYRMIWDGQIRGTISNIHACAPVAEGGCGAFNL